MCRRSNQTARHAGLPARVIMSTKPLAHQVVPGAKRRRIGDCRRRRGSPARLAVPLVRDRRRHSGGNDRSGETVALLDAYFDSGGGGDDRAGGEVLRGRVLSVDRFGATRRIAMESSSSAIQELARVDSDELRARCAQPAGHWATSRPRLSRAGCRVAIASERGGGVGRRTCCGNGDTCRSEAWSMTCSRG